MSKKRPTVNYAQFNPVGLQLLKYSLNSDIRTIILYGGSSSGKSYSCAQVMLTLALFEGSNTLVMRKVGASISKSIYEDFKMACRQLGYTPLFKFTDSVKRITCTLNGARIDFAGLDDPEKIKGISNYKRVVLDEFSEYDLADYKQIRKRLRGKRGQQIIVSFNPISETHWIKTEVIDVEQWHDVSMSVSLPNDRFPERLTRVKSIRMNAPKQMMNARTGEMYEHAPDMVMIQTTYLNNFWVVGSPDGKYGFYDEQCIADFEKDRVNDPDYYNVYALGEWGVIRTGSEFFGSFERSRHCEPTSYDPTLPIHISVDSNVLPYISITYWQCDNRGEGIALRQIGETCAGNPDNTVRRSAKLVAARLRELEYADKVYLHGDASTRAANNIDEQKRSFHDLFISTLEEEGFEVVDMVGVSNPSVQMSGEFVNAVWDGVLPGLSIAIGEQCRKSIEDYLSVQKDMNGGILKARVKDHTTGQSYERAGHLSDTLRYVSADLMKDDFERYSNRRKRNLYARDGAISYFNPDTECEYSAGFAYCIPDIGGKCAMLFGRRCGELWHITDAAMFDTSSTEEIGARLLAMGSPVIYIETGKAYFPFVRDLRRNRDLSVKVMPEEPDIDRRIAATSDFVRQNVRFDPSRDADEQYSAFLCSVLDYSKEKRGNREASAALSGFVKVAVKFFKKQIQPQSVE